MSRRRVALGVGANALDRVVVALMQLVMVPVLASHWGLERYGGWAMLITVPGLFALGDLGFANAATVRMTMEIARGERAKARVTVRSATQVVASACTAILCVVAALVLFLPDRWILDVPQTSPADLRWAIAALALYACAIMACALFQGVFRSNARFALGTVLSTVTTLLENGLLILVVFNDFGIKAGAFALLTGRLLGLSAMYVAAAGLRSGVLPALRGGDAAVRRELLGPALAAMSIPLATALLLQGTVAALGFVAGAAAVPAFVAARTLSRIGMQGSQMLTTALMPEFGAATARGDERAVRRMFVAVLITAATVAIVFSMVLAVAGPTIVVLWSNHHIHPPQSLMLAIAISALCGGIWNQLSNLILAINRQAEFAIAYAIFAATAVVATLLLGERLGSTAPGAAMAAADLAMLIVVGRFAMRQWGTGLHGTSRELARDLRGDLRRLFGGRR